MKWRYPVLNLAGLAAVTWRPQHDPFPGPGDNSVQDRIAFQDPSDNLHRRPVPTLVVVAGFFRAEADMNRYSYVVVQRTNHPHHPVQREPSKIVRFGYARSRRLRSRSYSPPFAG